MGKRAEAKAATRAAVIEGARTLFEQHGYDAVGIRQIGDAIGMSTGAIFANFASKAEVFEAAMGQPAPDAVAFLDSLIGADPETPVGMFIQRAGILRGAIAGRGK